jgi:hypothetical protein
MTRSCLNHLATLVAAAFRNETPSCPERSKHITNHAIGIFDPVQDGVPENRIELFVEIDLVGILYGHVEPQP